MLAPSTYGYYTSPQVPFSNLLLSTKDLTPDQFWKAVNGKSRILVLVRNTAGYIFGGYVEDAFIPRDDVYWVPGHANNFVFTLGNKTGQPMKLLKNHGDVSGVLMKSEFGFLMGWASTTTNDLRVGSGYCCSPGSYTTLAPGYSGVTIDNTLLAGSETWTPDLIEIFQCS